MSDGRDIDLTTDALPAETKRLVKGWADSVWTQGERFGTIGCQTDGWTYEITTHRAEAYDPESRKPEVVFSDVIEADLSRRDFTVNAMALSLPDPVLIDPFGGADDLAAGRADRCRVQERRRAAHSQRRIAGLCPWLQRPLWPGDAAC
jgi:poly(A) polymerase